MSNVWLPLILSNKNPAIGVQCEGSLKERVLPWLPSSCWVGTRAFWVDIEREPGYYVYPIRMKRDLVVTNKKIYSVKTTPPFYQEDGATAPCAPPISIEPWRKFLRDFVTNFQVDAIGVMNEPDSTPVGRVFGAFGPDGGGRYAEFLDAAYEEVKAISPNTIVVGGELAMVYPNFWKDVLATGARCDAVSYHAYTTQGTLWSISQKALQLRDFGETRPLWCTETAMKLWPTSPITRDFLEKQKQYWIDVVASMSELGIAKVLWYSFAQNGDWEGTSMIVDEVTKPVYHALMDMLDVKTA